VVPAGSSAHGFSLFTAIIAVVRQKLHSSSCSDFRDRLNFLSGGGKTIHLWNGDTGECLALLHGHAADVENVGWSADKRHFLSGDKQGGIHVWDLSFLEDA
jgi:WD40 repeat protein